MIYEQRYQNWLNNDYIKEEDKQELRNIADDPKEMEDRFYKTLEFGTAGLRGIMGVGTNRMNTYNVDLTTQALANYIIKWGKKAMESGVVIGYDSRNNSALFAQSAAEVLAGNHIKVYLFDSVRTVPQVSFSIRHLKCMAGIVITASHNPTEYNGYKVYWEEGYQIPPKAASYISEEMNNVVDFSNIRKMDRDEAIKAGYLEIAGKEIDHAYQQEILKGITRKKLIEEHQKDLTIVYSPLHGSGSVPVMRALEEAGFTEVFVVEEQKEPDGNFPTVKAPNPEDPGVFEIAREYGEKHGADLLLATDPDGDRLGVMYCSEEGQYVNLTGNEIGILLVEYLLETRKENGTLTDKGVIIKSVVSTELVEKIAADYGVEIVNTLTGFKYIGELMETYQRTKLKDYILGFEESYGYLPGTHCRDKDAVMTSIVLSEMALYYKSQHKSFGQKLEEIYQKYGYAVDHIVSKEMSGKEGAEKINKIVDYFRRSMPMEWIGSRVKVIEDYQLQRVNVVGEGVEKTVLPQANVIKVYLSDQSWFCIRPSGTEPKIKIYFSMTGKDKKEALTKRDQIVEEINQTIETIISE
ncbi:MAG TPA: phosphoglucomutase [Eubacteriaceae bacterium]|nr:phosphoglucomutase [Eubacteriaceae bacterium]